MTIDILRKTGGWCVELMRQITYKGKTIDQIEIRSPDLSQVARWGRGEVPSSMAMLAELSDVPEVALLSLTYPDVDRILLAYFQTIPKSMQDDFSSGRISLVTPPELLPEDQGRADDPIDARFPKSDGPVTRFVQPTTASPQPKPDTDGVSVWPRDEIMRAVG
jgi:hypothetical protein